jgi:putative flippase GtrA
MTPVFLIPAYNPDPALAAVVRGLVARGAAAVVVVDDGSLPRCRALFDEVAAVGDRVTLLRHPSNRGKGAALKTGFAHIAEAWPDSVGIVTLDADGQHDVGDALRVAERLTVRPGALVVGARGFDGEVPWRSRVGNRLTRLAFGAMVGLWLKDTQSGLRGIPLGFARRLLDLPANGYAFELDMLIQAKEQRVDVDELPIRTIYIAGNEGSHFNPVLDSIRIYASLLRYVMASMVTALLDNAMFIVATAFGAPLPVAQTIGRGGAFAVNYALVKRAVFHSDQLHRKALPRYLTLVVVSGLVSYGMIIMLNHRLDMPVIAAKLVAEGILYFANFLVQREFIFRRRRRISG